MGLMQKQYDTTAYLWAELREPGRALSDAEILRAVRHAMEGIDATDILAADHRAGVAAWAWLTYWAAVRPEVPLPNEADARVFLQVLNDTF